MTWPPPYLHGDQGDEYDPATGGHAQAPTLPQIRSYLEANSPSFSIRQLEGFTQFTAKTHVLEPIGIRTSSAYGDLAKINPGDPEPEIGPELAGLENGQYLLLFGATLTEKGPAGAICLMGLSVDGAAPAAGFTITVTEPVDDLVFPQPVGRACLLTLRDLPVGGHSIVCQYANSALALTQMTAASRWLIALRFNNP